MFQSVAVTAAPIEEPLPTEHCSVRQVQPQVFSHLTLLTLPATDSKETETLVIVVLVSLIPAVMQWLTEALKCVLLTSTCRSDQMYILTITRQESGSNVLLRFLSCSGSFLKLNSYLNHGSLLHHPISAFCNGLALCLLSVNLHRLGHISIGAAWLDLTQSIWLLHRQGPTLTITWIFFEKDVKHLRKIWKRTRINGNLWKMMRNDFLYFPALEFL